MALKLLVHGAAGTVTGSCYELESGGAHLLVDCGLFQGPRSLEALNLGQFAFDPRNLAAVVLTHAHLDHSGLLPKLARDGLVGEIWCTPPTADLLQYMLRDSARLNEQDAERRNRRRDRAGEPEFEPLYTVADAENALSLLRPVELDQWFEPAPGFRTRLSNAGHILGSASAEIVADGVATLFSGDLGPKHASLLADPHAPSGVDHVICESTYGDRERGDVTIEARRELLASEVHAALKRGGNLLIPSFALERTQELLLDLARLINAGRLGHIGIFIDSPLATKVTSVFGKYSHELEDLGDGEVFSHPAFHYVEDVQQSRALANMSGAIIIAGSGMCEGGRIRHHLLNNLHRSDSTLLFVGYQAAGTLGRTILDGAPRVRISGEDIAVRVQVREMESYSAHADRGELLAWIRARKPVGGTLFLTHGEEGALQSLEAALQKEMGSIRVPEIGEVYELPHGKPAMRLKTGRKDVRAVLRRDWQNDYADLAVNLKREVARIADEKRRREALRRMRDILHEYQPHDTV
ncbi:MAG: MBL fold metallo-hydrolase [Proteobacteria bacterium]|nr:MBL fold metallo-hydrolase [Pseudomonadota bacterium]